MAVPAHFGRKVNQTFFPHHSARLTDYLQIADGQWPPIRGDWHPAQTAGRPVARRPKTCGRSRATRHCHRGIQPRAQRLPEPRPRRPVQRETASQPPRRHGPRAAADPASDRNSGHRDVGRDAVRARRVQRQQIHLALRTGQHVRGHRHGCSIARRRLHRPH